MPRIEATVHVSVSQDVAFAVSQTTGETRLRWDPFIHKQHLLDGATVPAKDVRTETWSKHRLRMVTQYVSFKPPSQVGMRMLEGPWFFDNFGSGWAFAPADDGGTNVTWRYTFKVKPSWLALVADPIGSWLLRSDMEKRIAGFAKGCADPVVIAAVA